MKMEKVKKKRVNVYFDIRQLVKKLEITRSEIEEYTLFLSNAYEHLLNEEKEYLHSTYIKSKLGNNYLEKLKFLEKNGILFRGNTYIVGRESKRFFIKGMNNFSNKKVKMYVDNSIRTTMKKKFVFSDLPEINSNKENLGRLSIRDDHYHEIFKNKIKNYPNSAENKLYNELIQSFSQGESRITKRYEGERMYHFVSKLKKELRFLLLADGEEVSEIDMSSAHFYFLYLHLSNLIDFKIGAPKAELQRYKELVLNRNLYEFFLEEAKKKNYDFPMTRDQIKKRLISYLYTNPENYRKVNKNGNYYTSFHIHGAYYEMKSNFPFIHNFITKTPGSDLQKNLVVYESNYMLRKFSKLIKRRNPDFFYLNIHDAILCKKSEENILLNFLNQIFPFERPDFKVENIKEKFIELINKESYRKSRKKIKKEKEISTLKLNIVNEERMKIYYKTSKEKRIGDTKKQTLNKIKKIKQLDSNRFDMVNKLRYTSILQIIKTERSRVGHGDFQIIIKGL
ncbi:hypothetical protein AB3N58_17810 (plasmid) [Leptospira sp. WS60.C2]